MMRRLIEQIESKKKVHLDWVGTGHQKPVNKANFTPIFTPILLHHGMDLSMGRYLHANSFSSVLANVFQTSS